MVSSLFAALAALIAAVFAVAAPGPEPHSPAMSREPDVQSEAYDLRESIQALAREIAERAGVDTQSQPEVWRPETGPAGPAPAPSPLTGDGCTTDEASGEGWSRTSVRCVQESKDGGSSSVSVSSSSSVNVQEASSDDVP